MKTPYTSILQKVASRVKQWNTVIKLKLLARRTLELQETVVILLPFQRARPAFGHLSSLPVTMEWLDVQLSDKEESVTCIRTNGDSNAKLPLNVQNQSTW